MTERVLQFTNLPQGYTKERLRELAAPFGEVEHSHHRKNSGYVRFRSAEHAKNAFASLKDTLKGDGITIKLEHPSASALLAFLLIIAFAVYYFGLRGHLFKSIPKDAPFHTEEVSAHYPDHMLKGNTLKNFVKSGNAKSYRETESQRAKSKKAATEEKDTKSKKSSKVKKE